MTRSWPNGQAALSGRPETQSEAGDDIALDPGRNVYATGHTYSSDSATTAGAFELKN